MTHSSKLESYEQRMAAAGVNKFSALPPLWRILWRLGIRIPPPVFLGFVPNALIFGGFFSLVFVLLTWLLQGPGVFDNTLAGAPWVAAIAGVPFGLFMAFEHRALARRHNLGAWAAFSSGGAPDNSLKQTDQSLRD